MKSEKSAAANRPPKIKKIPGTHTILWRSFTVFAAGIILLIGIACYGVLGNSLAARARRTVSRIGEEWVEVFNSTGLTVNDIERKVDYYVLVENVNMFFFNDEGESVTRGYTYSEEALKNIYDGMDAEFPDWIKGETAEYVAQYEDVKTINYAACVEYKGNLYKVLVRYNVSPTRDAIDKLGLYILLVTLIALVLAFLVSYSIANRIARPLKEVADTAEKLGKGDYGVSFNSADVEEIAKLSATLNYMKDEIKKSDDFQKQIVANVSHDLKTPLTMIKAYALMIKEISGDDHDKRDKHLQVIIDESDRLTGLVNDILSTSKIRAGLEQLNLKVFNVTELLYAIINSFSYLQDAEGYKIMVDVDPNLYVKADEEKIKQVIYNLVSNAVNYTGEDKTVFVSLKYLPETATVRFAVRDTGKGIPEEEREQIWDRYYRSKDSHLRPVKGTGLGLSIVKAILTAHSFTFGIESGADAGSTFFVNFPEAPPSEDKINGN